jgi:hypothetical protein
MKYGILNPEFLFKKNIAVSKYKKLLKTTGELCPTYG